MTIYVDKLFTTIRKSSWPYDKACHMTTDSDDIEELHRFAAHLGLKRAWFQGHNPNPALHHYDLTEKKRQRALDLGAKELDLKAFSQRVFAVAERLHQQTKQQSLWD